MNGFTNTLFRYLRTPTTTVLLHSAHPWIAMFKWNDTSYAIFWPWTAHHRTHWSYSFVHFSHLLYFSYSALTVLHLFETKPSCYVSTHTTLFTYIMLFLIICGAVRLLWFARYRRVFTNSITTDNKNFAELQLCGVKRGLWKQWQRRQGLRQWCRAI